MDRILMGAMSAVLFALAGLIWVGPPDGRITMDRPAARGAMASEVLKQLETGVGRLPALMRGFTSTVTVPQLSRAPAEVEVLCKGVAREADAIAKVRGRGLYSFDQMITDAGDDPVLAWLVTLAWAVVPSDPDSAALDRFQTIVSRDCARVFT